MQPWNVRSEAFAGVAERKPAVQRQARRSNDLLAAYLNLIPKGRPQETYFWRIYLGGLPLFYFGGLPRLANVSPRESAEQRSKLARLSASLRSGPGGIRRARSNASAARISQSIRSGERCVSLFIVQLNSWSNLLRVHGSSERRTNLPAFTRLQWEQRYSRHLMLL